MKQHIYKQQCTMPLLITFMNLRMILNYYINYAILLIILKLTVIDHYEPQFVELVNSFLLNNSSRVPNKFDGKKGGHTKIFKHVINSLNTIGISII